MTCILHKNILNHLTLSRKLKKNAYLCQLLVNADTCKWNITLRLQSPLWLQNLWVTNTVKLWNNNHLSLLVIEVPYLRSVEVGESPHSNNRNGSGLNLESFTTIMSRTGAVLCSKWSLEAIVNSCPVHVILSANSPLNGVVPRASRFSASAPLLAWACNSSTEAQHSWISVWQKKLQFQPWCSFQKGSIWFEYRAAYMLRLGITEAISRMRWPIYRFSSCIS